MNYTHLGEECEVYEKGYTDCITDYSSGEYEGGGEALYLDKETGKVGWKNLGHCSCYGPDEKEIDWTSTLDELFGEDVLVGKEVSECVLNKARELWYKE